jgi:hypothetical protein
MTVRERIDAVIAERNIVGVFQLADDWVVLDGRFSGEELYALAKALDPDACHCDSCDGSAPGCQSRYTVRDGKRVPPLTEND